MANIVRALVFGSMAGGITITANYYYVRRTWKNEHPLISESLDLLHKDPAIVQHLGPTFDVHSSISGVLESGKNWANVHYEVVGSTGRGKVSLLADAKVPSELTETSEFPLEGSPPSYTFLDTIKYFVSGSTLSTETPNWRILSLHFKPDDVTSIPIIADGVRTHKDIKGVETVEPDKQVSSAVASKLRREKTYKLAQKRWVYMAGVCGVGLITFFMMRRFMRVHPIANSVFMYQALDIISTDVWVRSQLGMPIKNLQFVKGALNYNYSKGHCETLVFGPKNYGRLTAEGVFNSRSKRWIFSTVKIKIDGSIRSLVDEIPTK